MRTKSTIVSTIAFTALLGAWLLSWAHCTGSYSPREKLEMSAQTFYEAYRWNKPDEMKPYLPPEMMEAYIKDYDEKFKNVKVVDYEITEFKVQKGGKKAEVVFNFSWHLVDDMNVNEAVVVDRWELRAVKWYMVSRFIKTGTLP